MAKRPISKYSTKLLSEVYDQIFRHAHNNEHSEIILANSAIQALEPMAEKLKRAQYKPTYSGMGKDVKDANYRRTKLYTSLKNVLKGMLPFGGEEADAARVLIKEMEVEPNVPRLSYYKKSQAMKAVCVNLATSKSRALAEIAGVTNKVDALKEAQKDFEGLISMQQGLNADLLGADSGTELRPEANLLLQNALHIIEGMRLDPAWSGFYDDVQKVLIGANASYRDSSGKQKKNN